MSRSDFGWDLPPGVSLRDIDPPDNRENGEMNLEFKPLPDCRKEIRKGFWAEIWPMIFNHRIIVTDGEIVEKAWCYDDADSAVKAFEKWDGTGEPDGWKKNPHTGEVRIQAAKEDQEAETIL